MKDTIYMTLRALSLLYAVIFLSCINAEGQHGPEIPAIFDGLGSQKAFCSGREMGYYGNPLDKRYIYRCPCGSRIPTRGRGFFCAANGAVPSHYRGEKGFDVKEFCANKKPGTYVGPKDSYSIAIWSCPDCLPVEYCGPGHCPHQLNGTFAFCRPGPCNDESEDHLQSLQENRDERDDSHIFDEHSAEKHGAENSTNTDLENECKDPCECKKGSSCKCHKPTDNRPPIKFVTAIPKCAFWTTVTPCRGCGHHYDHEMFERPTTICLSTTYCNIKCTDIKSDERGCYCNGWKYEPRGCECKQPESS